MTATPALRSGPGRALIAVYGVLALAASFRSGYQLAAKFDEAPLAYILSAVAGLVYVLATIALLRSGTTWYRIALVAVLFELVGVLTVGTLSFVLPGLFAHPSVWSWFGVGYGFVPLVLPFLGLWWLRINRDRVAATE